MSIKFLLLIHHLYFKKLSNVELGGVVSVDVCSSELHEEEVTADVEETGSATFSDVDVFVDDESEDFINHCITEGSDLHNFLCLLLFI